MGGSGLFLGFRIRNQGHTKDKNAAPLTYVISFFEGIPMLRQPHMRPPLSTNKWFTENGLQAPRVERLLCWNGSDGIVCIGPVARWPDGPVKAVVWTKIGGDSVTLAHLPTLSDYPEHICAPTHFSAQSAKLRWVWKM